MTWQSNSRSRLPLFFCYRTQSVQLFNQRTLVTVKTLYLYISFVLLAQKHIQCRNYLCIIRALNFELRHLGKDNISYITRICLLGFKAVKYHLNLSFDSLFGLYQLRIKINIVSVMFWNINFTDTQHLGFIRLLMITQILESSLHNILYQYFVSYSQPDPWHEGSHGRLSSDKWVLHFPSEMCERLSRLPWGNCL